MEQLPGNLILAKKKKKDIQTEMIMNLLPSSSFCFYLAYLVSMESYIRIVHHSGNVKEQCRDDSPIHTQLPQKAMSKNSLTSTKINTGRFAVTAENMSLRAM